MFGQRQRVGDAAFAFLVGVVDMLQAELLAVGQQAQKIAGIPAAGHDQDVPDARIHQRLDRVVNHRLVVNRQQMLVGDFGQGKQPAARAAGENDALHKHFHHTIPAMAHYDWNQMPAEQLNPLVSRRAIHTTNLTIARLELRQGAVVPEHHHVHEQVATVERGALVFHMEGRKWWCAPASRCRFRRTFRTAWSRSKTATVVDVFSPAREDWQRGDDAYLR